MCTSLAMKTNDFYFGRNMDIDYSFQERVVITPRNYKFNFRKAGTLKTHSALIGMATVIENYPLYAEAMNEHGLCIAGLNFPDNAFYSTEENPDKKNITQFELIPFILGNCSSLADVKKIVSEINLIAIPFNKNIPLAQLHWHIADKNSPKSSIVIESTKDGIKIYDNPVNVLTNNPPFDFHMTNLSQYLNLNVELKRNVFSCNAGIKPFGQGLGSFGLPGDFSPTSRFVKIAYLLQNSKCKADENSSISQFFHLLDSVAVVNGSIPTDNYITTYSCCMNVNKGIYYYKTYFNNQIRAINLRNENLDSDFLKEFEIINSQQIVFEN